MLTLLLALPALAGTYTVDDACFAAQRAMPATTVEGIVRGVETIGSEDAVKLLRCGLAPALLSAVTEGAHPTAEEMSAALTAGSLVSVAAAKVYTGLSDRDWLRILGADLVLKTSAGEVSGRLKSVQLDELTVTTADGDTTLARDEVITVRRQDGLAIHVDSTEEGAGYREAPGIQAADLRPTEERGERLRRGGRALMGSGFAVTALGTVAVIAATAGASNPDHYTGTTADTAAVGGYIALAYLGYSCLVTGPPMIAGGAVMITIGNHQSGR